MSLGGQKFDLDSSLVTPNFSFTNKSFANLVGNARAQRDGHLQELVKREETQRLAGQHNEAWSWGRLVQLALVSRDEAITRQYMRRSAARAAPSRRRPGGRGESLHCSGAASAPAPIPVGSRVRFVGGGRFAGSQVWADGERVDLGDEGVVLKGFPGDLYAYFCRFPRCMRVGLERADIEPCDAASSPPQSLGTDVAAADATRKHKRADGKKRRGHSSPRPGAEQCWDLSEGAASDRWELDDSALEQCANLPYRPPAASPSVSSPTEPSVQRHSPPRAAVLEPGDSLATAIGRSRDAYFDAVVSRALRAREAQRREPAPEPQTVQGRDPTDAVLAFLGSSSGSFDAHTLAESAAADLGRLGCPIAPDQVITDFAAKGGVIAALHFAKPAKPGRRAGRPMRASEAARCVAALGAALADPTSRLRCLHGAELVWPRPAPPPQPSPPPPQLGPPQLPPPLLAPPQPTDIWAAPVGCAASRSASYAPHGYVGAAPQWAPPRNSTSLERDCGGPRNSARQQSAGGRRRGRPVWH